MAATAKWKSETLANTGTVTDAALSLGANERGSALAGTRQGNGLFPAENTGGDDEAEDGPDEQNQRIEPPAG